MKLYYSPGACSLSPHIVLRESGLPFTLERVNLATKKTETGLDFEQIAPKGYVPALRLDSGELLTEGPAIVVYLADLAPTAGLAPPHATLERARMHEWLTFIGTEIHKAFSPLFNRHLSEDVRSVSRAKVRRRLDFTAQALAGRAYLLGERFSVADAYLFTVLRWTAVGQLARNDWPPLAAFFTRMLERPAVQAALDAEQLHH